MDPRPGRRSDVAFLTVAGCLLLTCAAWLLSQDAVHVPLKRQVGWWRLEGARLWLVATGPVLVAAASLLTARRVRRGGPMGARAITPIETACLLSGLAVLVLAVVTAPRVPW